jgi:hypothetical protein
MRQTRQTALFSLADSFRPKSHGGYACRRANETGFDHFYFVPASLVTDTIKVSTKNSAL